MPSSTDALVAPLSKEDFSNEWARALLVSSKARDDPEWLLASVLKVKMVIAKPNPHPGMLSRSFLVKVSYSEGSDTSRVESWFVKVPHSLATAELDMTESFVYSKLMPAFTDFIEIRYNNGKRKPIEMPIPKLIFVYFSPSLADANRNHLVLKDMTRSGYERLTASACSVAYMRASIKCLAALHSTSMAYETYLGGKNALMNRHKQLKERNLASSLPKIKKLMETRLSAYLAYLSIKCPDLKHQLMLLTKFEKHLFRIFKNLHRTKEFDGIRCVIHGDSKIDNFLYKNVTKIGQEEEKTYEAVLTDWQGTTYDLLSGDLLWTLYGYMKNLPDKNTTVDTFLDYSITYYHEQLIGFLDGFKNSNNASVPRDDYDMLMLVKRGFVHEFMKIAIVNPIINVRHPGKLLDWHHNMESSDLPDLSDIFKNGENTLSFVHLFFTIATELGILHDLAPMCFAAMREAMFDEVAKDSLDLEEDPPERPVSRISQSEKESLLLALTSQDKQIKLDARLMRKLGVHQRHKRGVNGLRNDENNNENGSENSNDNKYYEYSDEREEEEQYVRKKRSHSLPVNDATSLLRMEQKKSNEEVIAEEEDNTNGTVDVTDEDYYLNDYYGYGNYYGGNQYGKMSGFQDTFADVLEESEEEMEEEQTKVETAFVSATVFVRSYSISL